MYPIKRGQAAAGAAVLLAIIAGILIMFIILVPPKQRAELLGESNTSTGTTLRTSAAAENLLKQSPGRLDFLAQRDVEHPLPVINIYTKTEGKVLAEKNVAYAKKGAFSEEDTEFPFSLAEVSQINNVLLSLAVDDIQGKLIILLNGEQIFNDQADVGPITPITLPKNSLQAQNKLVFRASSPGLAFWKTNEISLSKIKVVADVTNTEAQSSKNIFLLSETEKRNLERVKLKFQPNCELSEAGTLTIAINNNEIFKGIPDCDIAMVPIEFSPALVYQGENEIVFSAEKGTYVLSHVLIETKLNEVEFPTYYFQLSKEQFEDIQHDKSRLRLTMDFVDVVTRKIGDVVFNGHITSFDTKEVTETVDLTDDVAEGTNALKIKPRKTLEIREIRADLVK